MPKASGRPTDTEMQILHILWKHGRLSVRQVYEIRSQTHRVAYSTILTQMQFMHRKGMLSRDETYHSHIYKAVRSKAVTERSFVRSLVKNCFAGSVRSLVRFCLEGIKVPAEKIEEVLVIVDEYE